MYTVPFAQSTIFRTPTAKTGSASADACMTGWSSINQDAAVVFTLVGHGPAAAMLAGGGAVGLAGHSAGLVRRFVRRN